MIFLQLSFRREVGFYVLQVYIPLTIIVSCSFLSFWLLGEVTARSYLLGENKKNQDLTGTNRQSLKEVYIDTHFNSSRIYYAD